MSILKLESISRSGYTVTSDRNNFDILEPITIIVFYPDTSSELSPYGSYASSAEDESHTSSSSVHTDLVGELEATLKGLGMSVQSKVITEFLGKKDWILQSNRYEDLAMTSEIFIDAFSIAHLVRCANAVLTKFSGQRIIMGQKFQGKSQFMYFLFKLLQHCGAPVVYMKPTSLNIFTMKESVLTWWPAFLKSVRDHERKGTQPFINAINALKNVLPWWPAFLETEIQPLISAVDALKVANLATIRECFDNP